MKSAVLGLLTALLLLASAAAHTFLGWPQLHGILESAGVDADVIAALAIGWTFGSPSMPAFGSSAFLLRDLNLHSLLFVAMGLLVGLFGYASTGRAPGPGSGVRHICQHPEALDTLFDTEGCFRFSEASGIFLRELAREWNKAGAPKGEPE